MSLAPLSQKPPENLASAVPSARSRARDLQANMPQVDPIIALSKKMAGTFFFEG